jgi:hypothetical protein
MKNLYWIAAVSVLTGIAFFIPGTSGPIWTSLMGAMGVVGVFFLGLLAHIIRNGRSTGEKALGIGILALFAAFALHVGFSSYERARWKRSLLTETVRASVDRGRMALHLTTPLLKTLKARYRENTETNSLKRLFTRRYGERLRPDSTLPRFVPEDLQEERFPRLYYDSTEAESEVVLVGHSGSGNGEDPEFTNYDGSRGNLQYKSVLTPEGVRYVRKN